MNRKSIGFLVFSVTALGTLAGCGDDPVTPTSSSPTPAAASYVQVERLGRPGINEALVLSPDYLNAFNSIGPSSDLTTAAAPVVTEASAVLTAVANVGVSAGLIPYTDPVTTETVSTAAAHVAKVAAGFLPDVLRINTAVTLTSSATAYANTTSGCLGVVTAGGASGIILSCGRMIKDDVIDITYNYLAGGVPKVLAPNAALTDNVSYSQQNVSGAVASSRSAVQNTFPFLAKPY